MESGLYKGGCNACQKLEEQHIIRNETKKVKSAYAAMLGKDEEFTRHYIDFDFVAYDFLYKMEPNPDVFEIKQMLKIPKSRIEERHELMFSMMRERMINEEKYEREHFQNSKISKYSRGKWSNYRMKHVGLGELMGNIRMRRRVKGCKCQEEVDLLVHMYKNHIYHVSSTPGFDMTDRASGVLMLPGSEKIEAEAAIKAKEVNEAELEELWKSHKAYFKTKYMGPEYRNTEEDAELAAEGTIRDWKKEIAAKAEARTKRIAEEERESKEAEAKRMAPLTQWAKEMFQKSRDKGLPDEEIVEEVKKIALEKNWSESQINQVLQDNGVGDLSK